MDQSLCYTGELSLCWIPLCWISLCGLPPGLRGLLWRILRWVSRLAVPWLWLWLLLKGSPSRQFHAQAGCHPRLSQPIRLLHLFCAFPSARTALLPSCFAAQLVTGEVCGLLLNLQNPEHIRARTYPSEPKQKLCALVYLCICSTLLLVKCFDPKQQLKEGG